MKGLSRRQLGLLGLLGLSLLGTLVAILLGQWTAVGVGSVVSFGLFSVLVVLTLAALTRSMQRLRGALRATSPRIRDTAAGVRRLDHRTADRFKALDSTEARLEAAERRLLATFEAHRFQLEDDVADLERRLFQVKGSGKN